MRKLKCQSDINMTSFGITFVYILVSTKTMHVSFLSLGKVSQMIHNKDGSLSVSPVWWWFSSREQVKNLLGLRIPLEVQLVLTFEFWSYRINKALEFLLNEKLKLTKVSSLQAII